MPYSLFNDIYNVSFRPLTCPTYWFFTTAPPRLSSRLDDLLHQPSDRPPYFLTALPRPLSSGGSLRSLTASMTAARRWWADPDGSFFFLLLLLSVDVDEAEGASGSGGHEADQKARGPRAGASARKRRAAALVTAIGERPLARAAIEARLRTANRPARGCAASTTPPPVRVGWRS